MKDTAPALVLETRDGAVLRLVLNRAPAHPLSMAMIGALQDALDRAAEDRGVRVIVISAPGHVFCAGHDLKEISAHRDDADKGRAYLHELFAACERMMRTIVLHPKPTIAMVDGIATAAGCQIVASCDLAFASSRATFCLPGVNTGGFCTTPLVAVSRAMHRKHAMQMALSGEAISAETARGFGLVNEVLAPEELGERVAGFAAKLASRSPIAIAEGKRAFYRQLDLPLAEAYAHASAVMVEHFMTRDSEEGKRALFEKRPPVFRGE
jgi:enoyl-CoA hydratase/carnithine racemase